MLLSVWLLRKCMKISEKKIIYIIFFNKKKLKSSDYFSEKAPKVQFRLYIYREIERVRISRRWVLRTWRQRRESLRESRKEGTTVYWYCFGSVAERRRFGGRIRIGKCRGKTGHFWRESSARQVRILLYTWKIKKCKVHEEKDFSVRNFIIN